MQTLSVTEKGIEYLGYCLSYYSGGCAYFLLYVMALIWLMIKGSDLQKKVFIPSFFVMLITIFNPVFPIVLNKFFDVNNEYYRFFWIAPVVIVISIVISEIIGKCTGYYKALLFGIICVMIIISGSYLYKDGYIKSPNIYKMPTEIPQVAQMIHDDSDNRYEGDYYPRAAFEYDYEMCMRQYDASIMLFADREAYMNALSGKLSMSDIISEDNYYNRVLAVVALGIPIDSEEFIMGLDKTGTEYVCVSSANEDVCNYLGDNCKLRLVGSTANHNLYHHELSEDNYFTLPDYSDVWENY